AWEEWTGWVADRRNDPEFPTHLKGPIIKLTAFAGRMAAAIHVLREFHSGETAFDLEAVDMEAGARLGRYFLSHARKASAAMGRDRRVGDAQRVLAWIGERGLKSFSRRDAGRSLRRQFNAPEELGPPLKLLSAHGYIRWVDPSALAHTKQHSSIYE